LAGVRGILGFHGTPVENHCSIQIDDLYLYLLQSCHFVSEDESNKLQNETAAAAAKIMFNSCLSCSVYIFISLASFSALHK